ncbi:MAG: M6 family metalloprotease domain-containing protein [Microcystis aeruginosa Ma_AC_P_19900807_S299]|jgi:M6 family metalloprotease-like protein|nr:MAG: M6 family metalloprotease domain-containing protein [Microcystis aeruginosa Ma_AC_P_19900807_S299]
MPTPFVNEEFTFTNPDGSTIRVRGSGNQYYAVFETLDGYTVVKNPDNGFYTYAQLSEDKSQLIATDGIVGQVAPQSLGIQPHLSIETESAKQQAQSAPMLQEGFSQWRVRRQQKKTQLQGISATTSADARPASTVTVGNYLGLCILIKFPDVAASISQQEVSNFCNLPGYAGFGNKGSVRDYFYDNSQGKLTYTNVVTQYYTAAHNRSHYTNPEIDYGTRARELILEALNYLKSQGFNFSQLSSDSNGLIYALNVFYVGPRVNNWAEGLWPHSWSLASPYDVGGGKKLYDYQITNMGSELTLRTFCHENGHMICDFPDLYDYGGQSAGVGNYCLMCYGGNDKNPVQVCAYLKNEAGWASKVTAITPGLTASLPAAKNEFYLYSKNANEYFLIENRQKTGRDTFLPDAGLAIWHVDEQKNGNEEEQMTPSQHYECSLEQADNRFDLEKGVNAGDNADLFRASYKTEFSDSTSPAGKWWDGSNSGLKIAQISAVAATMTFTVPGSAWLEKKQITGLWMINQERNAAAYVDGLGWRKIASESDSVFLGMLGLLSAAQERKFPVNLRLENNVIQEIYVF